MLTPSRSNAAVIFLDLKEEIVKHSQTLPLARLRRVSGGLAKVAALHDLPVFVSAVQPGGAFLDEVLGPLAHPEPRLRTDISALADAGLVAALAATGRRVLNLSGVSSLCELKDQK